MAMPRVPFSLAVLLGIVTGGSLLYAWHLQTELAAAAAARARAESDRAALSREIADLRRTQAEALPQGPNEASTPVATNSADAASAGSSGVSPGSAPIRTGSPRERVPGGTPELRSLNAFERRVSLDSRFAGLFAKLNLSPADLEKFKDLLAQRQSTGMDVMNTAREQGLNSRESRAELRQLVSTLEAEADAAIQGLLGENGYQQYQEYERTLPQRNLANQLQQRLNYSSSPLTPAQTDQLVAALAASAAPSSTSGRGFRGPQVIVTDEVINQSQSFLYGSQLQALRDLQREQQTRARLIQQINSRNQQSQGSTP